MQGLTAAAIEAQINDLNRTQRGVEFQHILAMNLSEARAAFQSQREEIETAAQKSGLQLKLRLYSDQTAKTSPVKRCIVAARDDWDSDESLEQDSNSIPDDERKTARASPKRRRLLATTRKMRSLSTPSTIDSSIPSSSDTSFYDSCSTGSWVTESNSECDTLEALDENDFSKSASRLKPRLKIQFNSKGTAAPKRPRLLFRAFDPQHGLRARRFLNSSGEIPSPPGYETRAFSELASRHLFENKAFQSPFLSFTENPMRAMEIISASKSSLSLAIIDFLDVEENLEGRFGEGNGIWLVPSVCKDHKLNRLRKIHDNRPSGLKGPQKYYTGTGEVSLNGLLKCIEANSR